MTLQTTGRSVACLLLVVAALVLVTCMTPVYAVGIQGTMSNFDVFNETGINVYGAELELDGCLTTDVTKTYPSHFNSTTPTSYAGGTRFTFTGYNFLPIGYIEPTIGHSTNGHYAVNLPGCEHFGFYVVNTQPTNTQFFWLDQNLNRIGTAPMAIPSATWTYVPPAGGNPAVMQAVLAPLPPAPLVMFPDAVWVKTYVTELAKQADLEELISYDPDNLDPLHPSVAPQLPSEVEAEWELLPGDSPLPQPDIQLADKDQSILRRYEFYRYTGSYDEVHLPNSLFTGGTPLDSEMGGFIAANMVAVNLDLAPGVVPEPSTLLTLLGGLGMSGWMVRRRRSR